MNTSLIVLPILIPLMAAAIALLLRKKHRLQAIWSFSAMLVSLLVSIVALSMVWKSGNALVSQIGLWPAPFGITVIGDPLSLTFATLSQFVISLGMLYALGSKDQATHFPAFYPLFLTLATGLTGALLTGDLFNLFVFAELLVASGATLTAISDDQLGVEAAYKYFYISLLASIFLLVSIGILYVEFGTLNMADLAQRISIEPNSPLVPAAMIFLMVSFLIKSAVVPFHFWLPDFHTTSPTPISAMLSSVVVKLGIYGLIRMTTLLFPIQSVLIQPILIVLGGLGVLFGGLGAVGTHNLKRMLAYSTIGQIGFILVAIGWGTPFALAAAIIFTFNHSLIKSALLMLAGAVASRSPVKSAAFNTITGLGQSLPVAGALFFIGGMALAGIPPTNGFLSKYTVFRSGLISQDYLTLSLLAIASIISLIYVGRAFLRVWYQPPDPDLKPKTTGDSLIAPALLIGFCLLFGIWGEPLMRMAEFNVTWILEPARYIQAVLGG